MAQMTVVGAKWLKGDQSRRTGKPYSVPLLIIKEPILVRGNVADAFGDDCDEILCDEDVFYALQGRVKPNEPLEVDLDLRKSGNSLVVAGIRE
jgi:hypothetical protein